MVGRKIPAHTFSNNSVNPELRLISILNGQDRGPAKRDPND